MEKQCSFAFGEKLATGGLRDATKVKIIFSRNYCKNLYRSGLKKKSSCKEAIAEVTLDLSRNL